MGWYKIKIVFPIRGHSYMECDKNIGPIKKINPLLRCQKTGFMHPNSLTKSMPFQGDPNRTKHHKRLDNFPKRKIYPNFPS